MAAFLINLTHIIVGGYLAAPKILVQQELIDYCRFPAPRTLTGIITHLKLSVPGFYPKSRPDLVVKFLKKNFLNELVDKKIVLHYAPGDSGWKQARAMLQEFCTRQNLSLPRKVNELYQINFFYLSDEFPTANLPALNDINLELVVFAYPFVRERNVSNFFWNILNLLYCCSDPQLYDKLHLEFYKLDFTEKERRLLENLAARHKALELFFLQFPFKPNIEQAMLFLREL